jgi:hypothetical protein
VTNPAADLRTPGVIAISIAGGSADEVKAIKNSEVRDTANAILKGFGLGLVEYTEGECPEYEDTGGKCSSFITLSSKGSGYGVAFFQLQKDGKDDARDDDLYTAVDKLIQAAETGVGVTLESHPLFRIQGASPNWVMLEKSQGTGHGGGSPGGPPTAASDLKAKTDSATIDYSKLNLGGCEPRIPPKISAPVYVYVLDTGLAGIPSDGQNFQQRGTWPIAACLCPAVSNCQSQPLVKDLGFGVAALAMGGFIKGKDAFLDTSMYPKKQASWMKYHGLAVGELIHHQASGAQLVLMPVLNEYGIGTLQTLLTGLHHVQTHAHDNGVDASRVLVNMSLSVEPPTQCLMHIWQNGWGESTSKGAVDPSQCSSSSADDLGHGRLIRPLSDFVQAMTDAGFTVVAAAGNDSANNGSQPQYGADFPAVLCGVVSVAATRDPIGATTDPTGAPAWKTGGGVTLYDKSNGPFFSPNGSATSPDSCLNGDAKTRVARGAYALGSDVCSIDMEMEAPNGMGRWSGTSFATALTSGNLASAMLLQGGSASNTSPYDQVQDFSEEQPCG